MGIAPNAGASASSRSFECHATTNTASEGNGQRRKDDVHRGRQAQGLRPEREAQRHDRRPGETGDAGCEVEPPYHPLHRQRRLQQLLRPRRAALQCPRSQAGDHVVETAHHHLQRDGDDQRQEAEPRHGGRVPPQGQEAVQHEHRAEDDDDGHGVGQRLVARHRQREVAETGGGHGVHRAASRRERIAQPRSRGPDQQRPAPQPLLRPVHHVSLLFTRHSRQTRCKRQ